MTCIDRIQGVDATPGCWSERNCSSNASAGVFQPRTLRGLVLRACATAATEDVEHGRQIDPALVGGVLGDVGDPQPIRAVGVELPLHGIRPDGLGPLVAPPTPPVDARQPVQAHEAGDPPSPHRLPTAQDQLSVDTPIPVGRSGRGVDVDDLVQQNRVVDVPGRGPATTPLVEPRRRHLQHPARHRHGKPLGSKLADEPEPHFGSTFSLAK